MASTILVTGGAGFAGSTLCTHLKQTYADSRVIALDNLKRRGSELNINRLQKAGVEFVHGDVRNMDDLAVGKIDWLIECSAEPSVHAGTQGGLAYLMDTNLQGALNCLECARHHQAKLIFLSSSRIYSIDQLRALPLEPSTDHFALHGRGEGWSERGIAEAFSTQGPRSFYGSTKLSAELFIEEYAATYGLQAVINRCGVLAGPWQMGKVDQGFMALWLSKHLWGGQLSYLGFGGEGMQVRDVLHAQDLAELIVLQMNQFSKVEGQVFNVGGGLEHSVSLRQLTSKVSKLTSNSLDIKAVAETKAVDIPFYVTDNSKIQSVLDWTPTRNIDVVLEDTLKWLVDNQNSVKPVFQV